MDNDRPFFRRDLLAYSAFLAALGFVVVEKAPSHKPSNTEDSQTSIAELATAQNTKSIPAGLWTDPWKGAPSPSEFEMSNHCEGGTASVGEIVSDFTSQGPGLAAPLLVMPVICNGKSGLSDAQGRTRRRHAVELALATSGFSMKYKDRMTYQRTEIAVSLSPTHKTRKQVVVPIKLYSSPQQRQNVLVVWLKDHELGASPLDAIRQVLVAILGNNVARENRSLVIIGPAFSETLNKILGVDETDRDLVNFYEGWKGRCYIANIACTSSHIELGSNVQLQETTIPVRDFIGRDNRLVTELKQELGRRGLGPSRDNSVLLFCEQGSFEYIQSIEQQFTGDSSPIVVPYLKGIGDESAGDGQLLDYLDRSLQRLRNRQEDQVTFLNQIHAVGLLGSSIDDKLAILRAARRWFPSATFFTTDLDFRYSSAKNAIDCRNLLIASQYGFGLEGNLFGIELADVPSFRNVYQTSTFLGVSVAIQSFVHDKVQSEAFYVPSRFDEQQDLYGLFDATNGNSFQPLLYEIGRLGPVQLTRYQTPTHFAVHQPNNNNAPLWFYLFTALLFVGVVVGFARICRYYSDTIDSVWRQLQIFVARLWRQALADFGTANTFLGGRRRRYARASRTGPKVAGHRWNKGKITSRWLLFSILFGATIVLVAVVNDRSPFGEPITFADGISIWPPVLIQFFVLVLSVRELIRRSFDHHGVPLFEAVRASTREEATTRHTTAVRHGVAVAVVLSVWILGYMLLFGEFHAPPARSLSSRLIAMFTHYTSAAALLVLAAISAVQILQVRKRLATRVRQDLSIESDPQELQIRFEELKGAMETGYQASRKLVLPALLACLFAVARFPVLDSWRIHASTYLIILTPLVLSVIVALVVRVEVRRFRQNTLLQIDSCIAEALANPHKNDDYEKTRLPFKKLILGLSKGPFGPLSSDPLLGGLLLLASAFVAGPLQESSLWIISFL